MDIAKVIEQVRSKLKGDAVAEALGESNLASINAALRDLSVGAQELQELLHTANEESKGRKIKIRTLEGEMEELQEKHDNLASDTGKEALETEVKGLREFKTTVQDGQRKAFSADFMKIVDHPAFEKASALFTLPKKSEDGKEFVKDDAGAFDFSELSPEQMTANADKLQELTGVGLFDVADDKGNQNQGDGRQRQRSNGNSALEEIKGAKTMEELNAIADRQSRASS